MVPSSEWGGAERYAFDICRYFRSIGWDTRVLTRDARIIDAPFEKAGIPISHAPLRSYPDYYSARILAGLFAKIPEGRGIVHVHRLNDALTSLMARKLARRPDIRIVSTRHKARKGRNSFLRRIIYRGIDSQLFVSEFCKDIFFSAWKPGKAPLPETKTAVSYNSLFLPPRAPSGGDAPGPVSAAYRGKLKPGKGLETLIDAFALIKGSKIRLRIMGKGKPDYVDSLRRRAQLAGIADLIDWSRDTDFAEATLAKVHFGVLPSDEPEAFGMANLEFMASAKPQIATFTGAQSEILTEGADSLIVPPADPTALADAILKLGTDSSLRQEMGRQALQNFDQKFAWPHFVERLMPHYLPSKQ